jgi:hypothetical protein
MLSLGSPRWADLQHAYGSAADIPDLLRKLSSLPDDSGKSQPWYQLWSSLAHQGDVYSASFAAVPHIVDALATAPRDAPDVFFHFPAWVEICRKRKDVPVPEDLLPAYTSALDRIPELIAAASSRPWNADMVRVALAALAAVKGDAGVAKAALELSPDVAANVLEWLEDN